MTGVARLAAAYAGLLVLLAATVGSSFVELGVGNVVLNLGIAVAKSALIVWVFMHLRTHGVLVWLTGGAALLWLGILFGLTLAAY